MHTIGFAHKRQASGKNTDKRESTPVQGVAMRLVGTRGGIVDQEGGVVHLAEQDEYHDEARLTTDCAPETP